jgi:hypothetical protein
MNLTPETTDRLRNILSYFRTPSTLERLWSVTTIDERRPFKEIPAPLEMVQHVAKFRGISFERAMIDMAMEASVISFAEHLRLRRKLDDPVTTVQNEPRPSWNKKTSELQYKGVIIHRVVGRAPNLRIIFQALEEEKWPKRIDNPLPGPKNPKKLSKTLSDFNAKNRGIRLSPQGGGMAVSWEATN